MRFLLLDVPPPLLVLLIVGGSAALAMLATYWVRTRVNEQVHQANNEVAGFIFAALAVLYGVLLAFMVLVVWQAFQDARITVENEANAVLNIYRLGQEVQEPYGAQIRSMAQEYAREVVNDEWTAMSLGASSQDVADTLEKLWLVHRDLDNLKIAADKHDAKLFDMLEKLGDYRRVRLLQAREEIPPLLWNLLIAGAFITIGFTLFFRAPNWIAHLLMAGMFAGLTAFVLLLIVELDTPFAGDIHVDSLAFQQALEIIARLGGN